MFTRRYLLGYFFLSLSVCLYSQSKWTLRKCIDYAIENNIEIKQQAISEKGAEIDLNTSKNSRLPDLNAKVGHHYNLSRFQLASTGVIVPGTSVTSLTDAQITSSTPLFTGFKIQNEIKSNELNLLAATENLKKARENMELKVTSLFLDALFKKEVSKVYKDVVELNTHEVERTEVLVKAGKVPLSQLYDIKAQLAKDELNLTMANNDLTLSLLQLFQALNLTDFKGFDIADPNLGREVMDNHLSSILPPEDIYRIAVETRPHVKEVEYKLESSRKQLKIAQAGYWPTLSLDLSYYNGFNRMYKKHIDNKPITDQLRDNNREMIGVTMSIPIFSRFQVRNKVNTARLNIENQELALDNVKLVLFQEIQQAYHNAVAAQVKYSSTDKAMKAAEESFKYAQERYSLGKLTVFEFNATQSKLFSSRSEQLQAKYDFLFRTKILDFYRGKKIDIE